MKKLLTIIIIMFCITLNACKFETTKHENEITFYVEEDYKEHFLNEILPIFNFEFEGELNTSLDYPNFKSFSRNDDFYLSDILIGLFSKYESNMATILTSITHSYSTKMNKNIEGELKSVDLIVEEGRIYNQTSYISLENGLKLSIEYRYFKSEGKSYYAWQYRTPINIMLHYPFIVVEINQIRKFVLITLPLGVTYTIGVSSRGASISTLLRDKKYIEEKTYFYSFPYLNDGIHDNLSREDRIELIKEYYTDYGYYENEGKGYFSYLGYLFRITYLDYGFTICCIL